MRLDDLGKLKLFAGFIFGVLYEKMVLGLVLDVGCWCCNGGFHGAIALDSFIISRFVLIVY